MEFYNVRYETYRNGELYYQSNVARVIADEVMEDEIIPISWDNVEEVYFQYGIILPFTLCRKDKGLVVYYFDDGLFGKKVKSWKTADLDLELRVVYDQYTPSINEVLNWHDGEKASQYLKEKGWRF